MKNKNFVFSTIDLKKFGKKLRECRNNMNLTQEQLADILFVKSQAVSKWECGKALPVPDTIFNICKLFGITFEELSLGELTFDKDKRNIRFFLFIFNLIFAIILFSYVSEFVINDYYYAHRKINLNKLTIYSYNIKNMCENCNNLNKN